MAEAGRNGVEVDTPGALFLGTAELFGRDGRLRGGYVCVLCGRFPF